MWPRFDSWTQRHKWVEFVGSLLCTERFFFWYSGYSFSLRTVPTIVIAHIRSAHLEILGFPIVSAYYYRDIFARFKTMRRKQNLASEGNWG